MQKWAAFDWRKHKRSRLGLHATKTGLSYDASFFSYGYGSTWFPVLYSLNLRVFHWGLVSRDTSPTTLQEGGISKTLVAESEYFLHAGNFHGHKLSVFVQIWLIFFLLMRREGSPQHPFIEKPVPHNLPGQSDCLILLHNTSLEKLDLLNLVFVWQFSIMVEIYGIGCGY